MALATAEPPSTRPTPEYTMRKANQTTTDSATIEATDRSIKEAAKYLDSVGRKKAKMNDELMSLKRTIAGNKSTITAKTKENMLLAVKVDAMVEQLQAMPSNSFGEASARALLERVSRLPWVGKVVLNDRYIVVDTRPDSLKTVFYERIVYNNEEQMKEVLDKPLVLPMPTYQIAIELANMGGSWDRNSHLQIRLLSPQDLKFNVDEGKLGLHQEGYAHWASNETPWYAHIRNGGTESSWSSLCTNRYRDGMKMSAETDLIELLNDVAIFLQNSGWASAYRSKMTWATLLGFQPYYEQLLRPLVKGETFDSIQASNRDRLPKFLAEAGITMHQYEYGAVSEESRDEARRDDRIDIAERLREMVDQGIRYDGAGMIGGGTAGGSITDEAGTLAGVWTSGTVTVSDPRVNLQAFSNAQAAMPNFFVEAYEQPDDDELDEMLDELDDDDSPL